MIQKTQLFVNAHLVDPESGLEIENGCVRVTEGIIQDIAPSLQQTPDDIVIDCNGYVLTTGLIDMKVSVGHALYGHRETLKTAGTAAVAHGITTLLVQPDCDPVLDDPTFLEFVLNHAQSTSPARVFVAAALTKGLEGDHLSEVGLLTEAGAICFSAGDRAIENTNVLVKALTYSKVFDALVMLQSSDTDLSSGVMNAGDLSLRLGLSGISTLSETLGLERDLQVLKKTGAKGHIHILSCGESVDILKHHRKKGLAVSVGTTSLHLILNENDVVPYRTFCKVFPPLRSEEDRMALVQAVCDGDIDVVVSGHIARTTEQKRLPFGEASFGAAGLETLLSVMLNLWHKGYCSLSQALKPVTCNPARVLGLPDLGRLQKGCQADLVLIDVNASQQVIREKMVAQGTNTPLEGYHLEGIVQKTWVGGKEVYCK